MPPHLAHRINAPAARTPVAENMFPSLAPARNNSPRRPRTGKHQRSYPASHPSWYWQNSSGPDEGLGQAVKEVGVVVHTYQGETSGSQAESPALL